MKFLRFLFTLYAAIIFVVLMLLIFPLVVIASLWGRIKGENMIYRLCTFWADVWFALVCIHVKKIYQPGYRKTPRSIIVANHISYMDIPMLVKVFREPVRPLGKIEMTKVPIFGFIYKNAIVTVDRSDAAHRAASLKILRSILNKGISIFVFPEGTFNETHQPLKEFYNGAFKLAVETQTPIQPVLFLDTFDRMHYSSVFSLNPGISRVVFLDTVSVANKSMHTVKEEVFLAMEQALREYRATWIKG